jgi:inhibitor of cysteine peptidase
MKVWVFLECLLRDYVYLKDILGDVNVPVVGQRPLFRKVVVLLVSVWMLKLKVKKKPKLNQKLNKMKFGLLVILGWLVNNFCFASTLELTVQPNTVYFYFNLPSNPTTGYRWSIKSFDSSSLKFNHSDYKTTNSNLIGGGGVERFYFNVLAPQKGIDTYIELTYSRPWEKEVVNTQKVHIYTIK